jgi:hypothetical protein
MEYARRHSAFPRLKLERVAAIFGDVRTRCAKMTSRSLRRARAEIQDRLEQLEGAVAEARDKRSFRLPIWATLVLMIVAAAVTQAFTHQGLERRHAVETRQVKQIYESEKTSAHARAREAFAQATDDAYQLLGNSLAWSVRNALVRNKYDELGQYFTELARHERVSLVLLADRNGKVVLASDPTLKGTEFSRHFPASFLSEPAITVRSGAGDQKSLVVPINRYTTRLGTALMVYEPRPLPK